MAEILRVERLMTPPQPPAQLQTPRLVVRRRKDSDVAAIFAYASSIDATRYMDWPRATTVAQVEAQLAAMAQAWEDGTTFNWVVQLCPAGAVIGSISCWIDGTEAGFGCVFHPGHWGNGYGTEAGRAVVDWLGSVPMVQRIYATCDCENLASARVLAKLGLVRERRLPQWAVRPQLSPKPRDAWLYSWVRPS